MEQKELQQIAAHFQIEGKIAEVKPLGNGLINTTYMVVTEGDAPDYVLQNINNAIFPDVDLLMNNIVAVTGHIHANADGTLTAGWDTEDRLNASGALSKGTWKHIALVVDGNKMTAYVNGTEKASITSDKYSGIGGFGNLVFKSSGDYAAWDAKVDELRIWKTARTADEIKNCRNVEIGEAGIIDYHEGELPDPRMRRAAQARGYRLTHRSRPIRTEDFRRFDLIIGMDSRNCDKLRRLAPDEAARQKVQPMAAYLRQHPGQDFIPDPYYGTADDFNHVVELLEDACAALLEKTAGV